VELAQGLSSCFFMLASLANKTATSEAEEGAIEHVVWDIWGGMAAASPGGQLQPQLGECRRIQRHVKLTREPTEAPKTCGTRWT
jgi:hypothetical protein